MGIHISLVILVGPYTKHGDTHITVTPATDYPRASRSFPRIAGSGNEIAFRPSTPLGNSSVQRLALVSICENDVTSNPTPTLTPNPNRNPNSNPNQINKKIQKETTLEIDQIT